MKSTIPPGIPAPVYDAYAVEIADWLSWQSDPCTTNEVATALDIPYNSAYKVLCSAERYPQFERSKRKVLITRANGTHARAYKFRLRTS